MNTPKIFEPGQLSDSNTAIVLTNHFGSTVQRANGELGHTGREAQAIADLTGRNVIAFNRPGTGDEIDYSEHMAVSIKDYQLDTATRWSQTVEPYVRNIGAQSVHLLGRSAGAAPLFSIACAQILPVTAICAVEPLGLQEKSLLRAQNRWAGYTLLERSGLLLGSTPADTHDYQSPHAASNMGSLQAKLKRRQIDFMHNQAVWTSADTYYYAALAAYTLEDIELSLVFAERPMPASRKIVEQRAAELKAIRGSDDAVCTVTFMTGSTHRSFNTVQKYVAAYNTLQKAI